MRRAITIILLILPYFETREQLNHAAVYDDKNKTVFVDSNMEISNLSVKRRSPNYRYVFMFQITILQFTYLHYLSLQ